MNDIKGFSLIEILISMVVFSVGVLAVTALQVNTLGYDSRSRRVVEMTTVVTDKMEEITALAYDHADLATGVSHTPSPDDDGLDNDFDGVIDNVGGETGNLSVSWAVAEDTVIGDSKNVTVTAVLVGSRGTETFSLLRTKVRE